MARHESESYSEEIHEESSWRLPARAALVLLILSGALLYYYLGPSIRDITGDNPDASSSSAPVLMTIGDTRFVIPANYTRYPRARRGGQRDMVALYTLFPRFSGFTVSDSQEFNNNGATSQLVHFEIEDKNRPYTEAERFEHIYRSQLEDVSGFPAPYGLTKYDFRKDTPYGTDEIFIGELDSGEMVLLRCLEDEPGKPAATCRRDTELGDGLALSYRFKRRLLEHWQDIDAGVKILVNRFRQEGLSQS